MSACSWLPCCRLKSPTRRCQCRSVEAVPGLFTRSSGCIRRFLKHPVPHDTFAVVFDELDSLRPRAAAIGTACARCHATHRTARQFLKRCCARCDASVDHGSGDRDPRDPSGPRRGHATPSSGRPYAVMQPKTEAWRRTADEQLTNGGQLCRVFAEIRPFYSSSDLRTRCYDDK